MQNRPYDRYVELLRAAELQSYERTSARFVASVGSVGAMSWLTRVQWIGWISSILLVSASAALFLVASSKEERAERIGSNTMQVASDSKAASGTSPHFAIAKSHTQSSSHGSSVEDPIESEPPANTQANSGLEAAIMLVAAMPDSLPQAITSEPNSVGQLMNEAAIETAMSHHEWSVMLEGSHLTVSQPLSHLDGRLGVALDISNGLSLGVGIGFKSIEEHTSTFAGYTDTIFIIDEQELPSKIGKYATRDRSVSSLVAGISAKYRLEGFLGSERLLPFVAVFNGLEGKTLLLEQSAGMEWRFSDRLGASGGVSIREYPLAHRKTDLSPQLGLRFRL